MKNKELKGKLLIGIVVCMLVIIFGGCSSKNKPYSKNEAKNHVSDWLSDKYTEDFKITLFEKRQGSSGPFGGTPFYYYEATSTETGVSFSGTTSYYYRKGEKGDYSVSDQYEETLYEDRFAKEIAAIPNDLDKWGNLSQSIFSYRGRDMKEKSADYDAYKSDSEKVSVTVSYRLYSEDKEKMDEMIPSIYEYLKTIYDINNNLSLSIYNIETSSTGARSINFIKADAFTLDYLKEELYR